MVIVLIAVLDVIFLKQEALGGLIMGAILSSLGLIFFSSNSSIVLKSARKYLKSEYVNAVQSDEYEVLTSQERLFKSLKDLIAPPLNALIKFLAVLALVFAPLLMF